MLLERGIFYFYFWRRAVRLKLGKKSINEIGYSHSRNDLYAHSRNDLDASRKGSEFSALT